MPGLIIERKNKKNSSYSTFDNDNEKEELPATSYGDPSQQGPGYTVDDAVEHFGLGTFQYILILILGLAWVADGAEILLMSIIGPVLVCEWNIEHWQEALLTTVVFIGFAIGSPFFGLIADKYGRKKSIIFSAAWTLHFGVICGLAPNLLWLLLLRAITGVGVGGLPQVVTYCAELLPVHVRAKSIILLRAFFAVGGMYEALIAMALIDPYGWRLWLAISAAPLVVFLIFAAYLPESARYLVTSGDAKGAKEILDNIAKINNKSLPEGNLMVEKAVETGRFQDMFLPQYLRTTILLAFIWFSLQLVYYGLVLLNTVMVSMGTTCSEDWVNDFSYFSCKLNCHPLEQSDYNDIFINACAELIALLITAMLIDKLGRIASMCIGMTVFAMCSFGLLICMDRLAMVALLFVARAVAASTVQMLYIYTSEVYPTYIRGISMGMGSSIGRCGVLCTPYIAQVMVHYSLRTTLAMYGGIAVLCAVCIAMLPIETKGRSLQN